ERLQAVDVTRADRNVEALVPAIVPVDEPVVVAKRARMNLHHEAVVDAHARHFSQHLGSKQLCVSLIVAPGQYLVEKLFGTVLAEIGSLRGGMAMIGRRSAHAFEKRAPRAMRGEVAAPAAG